MTPKHPLAAWNCWEWAIRCNLREKTSKDARGLGVSICLAYDRHMPAVLGGGRAGASAPPLRHMTRICPLLGLCALRGSGGTALACLAYDRHIPALHGGGRAGRLAPPPSGI